MLIIVLILRLNAGAGLVFTGRGSRTWTGLETQELLTNGKVPGYYGHHINSVAAYPALAGNPNNINL